MPAAPNNHHYPYVPGDQITATLLNNIFEMSAGPAPPSGRAGGAGQFKQWMDTSVSPPALRIATAARAAAGSYNAAEWATMGVLDTAARQFNYSGGWSGDIHVGGSVIATADIIGRNLYLSGNYIGFAGSNGLTNGPYINVDAHSVYLRLGTSYAGFSVQDQNSTYRFVLDSLGKMYINSIPFATADAGAAGYNTIYDHAGNSGIGLGDSHDPSTYIRNTYIMFGGIGSGGANFGSFDAAGIHTPNQLYANNINLSGYYLGFRGATDLSAGPYIYVDTNAIYMRLPAGNVGFVFQNASGANCAQFTQNGIFYLGGFPVASVNPADHYNYFYDYSQVGAILLGATENIYRNNLHAFGARSDSGGATQMTLDAGGNIVLTGTLTTGAAGSAVINVTNGGITAAGASKFPVIYGGADGNAGTLQCFNTSNKLTFRWDGTSIFSRIDGNTTGIEFRMPAANDGITAFGFADDGGAPAGKDLIVFIGGVSYRIHCDTIG